MITGGEYIPNTPPKYKSGDYVVWTHKDCRTIYRIVEFIETTRKYKLYRLDIDLYLDYSQNVVEKLKGKLTEEEKAELL